MGKNKKAGKKKNVFKMAGAKSLKAKMKAKPFTSNLKKINEIVRKNVSKIDKELANVESDMRKKKERKSKSTTKPVAAHNSKKPAELEEEKKETLKKFETIIKSEEMGEKVKKAGLIVIGNEILKGQVKDINSVFICKRLQAVGVRVCRISTVPDDVEEIAEEVARFSAKYDFVLTTGGIGPTHDDITYEGIATAFGDKIVLHSEMAEVIKNYFHGSGDIKSNPVLKMALIPQSSKLIYVPPKKEQQEFSSLDRHNGLQLEKVQISKAAFPVVQVRNVYVLPGLMEWLEHAMNHLERIFENPEVDIYTMTMFIKLPEVGILNELNKAVSKFGHNVIFGSYPSNSSQEDFQTKVTLEGFSLDDVTSAYSYLKSIMPPQSVSDVFQDKDMNLVYDLTNGTKSLSKIVKHSLQSIEVAFKKYKSKEIYISFNGGKDCTVLLHLVWAVNKMVGNPEELNGIYVKSDVSFPEVDAFVAETIKRYKLNIVTVCGAMKSALNELHRQVPEIKAIFMGTRGTDPRTENLKEFQMCDKDWPPFMRVNPILEWSYQDIWDFLRILAVPYCSLYDEGYTSIGNPKNSQPNPALKISGTGGRVKYEPAYKLKDGSLERQGRQ